MKILNEFFWRLVVVIHFLLIGMTLLSIPFILVNCAWYVDVPLLVFYGNLFFNRAFSECPITLLENKFRKKCGKPQIRGFLGHYVYSKVRRFKRRNK